jgi:coenzyme F420-reducing hydrogenase beta subunit
MSINLKKILLFLWIATFNEIESAKIIKATKRNSILLFATNNPSSNKPKPIDPKFWPSRFPAKDLCSKCGLCETSFVQYVDTSCAFLNEGMGKIDHMEHRVHGRRRNYGKFNNDDEGRFGVLYEPILLGKGISIFDEDKDESNNRPSQWTGVVTNIALACLENNLVDAVVCIAADDNSQSSSFAEPLPIIAKTTKELKRGRGVKPSLAPSLNLLDQIQNDKSIKKLLFCGVGCAVQAFRSIEHKLNLDEVYVLGTNCADNSPTSKASTDFIQKAMEMENVDDVLGYEFMQDYRVHVKTRPDMMGNQKYKKKPYFCLPREVATEAIAKSCLACFDYTNALADVVVGYMGSPLEDSESMDSSFQTVTCRNLRGKRMIETAVQAKRIILSDKNEAKIRSRKGMISYNMLALSTVKEDVIVQSLTQSEQGNNNQNTSTMPLFLGEVLARLMTFLGPKGLDFAKYSIDYHVLRNYLFLINEWGLERSEKSLPQYVKQIVQEYQCDSSFLELQSVVLSNRIQKNNP